MNYFNDINAFHFGETTYTNGGRFKASVQPQMEFIIVHSGHVEINVDKHHRALSEGFALLVYSEHELSYSYQKNIDSKVSWCEAILDSQSTGDVLNLECPFTVVPVSRRMLDLQRMGMDLGYASDSSTESLKACFARALYQEVLFQAQMNKQEQPIHRAVLRGRQYIEQNHSKECTLNQVANYANVTPQYLTKLFKRDFEQTPIQFLWRLRAKKASHLIRRTGLSIAEIAYSCGYENPNHFSRHIKEQFGLSPTNLRRKGKPIEPF